MSKNTEQPVLESLFPQEQKEKLKSDTLPANLDDQISAIVRQYIDSLDPNSWLKKTMVANNILLARHRAYIEMIDLLTGLYLAIIKKLQELLLLKELEVSPGFVRATEGVDENKVDFEGLQFDLSELKSLAQTLAELEQMVKEIDAAINILKEAADRIAGEQSRLRAEKMALQNEIVFAQQELEAAQALSETMPANPISAAALDFVRPDLTQPLEKPHQPAPDANSANPAIPESANEQAAVPFNKPDADKEAKAAKPAKMSIRDLAKLRIKAKELHLKVLEKQDRKLERKQVFVSGLQTNFMALQNGVPEFLCKSYECLASLSPPLSLSNLSQLSPRPIAAEPIGSANSTPTSSFIKEHAESLLKNLRSKTEQQREEFEKLKHEEDFDEDSDDEIEEQAAPAVYLK